MTNRRIYSGVGIATYNPKWRKPGDDYVEWPGAKIMWATEAQHMLADISRIEGDYCSICGEEGDCYRGHWITGIGMINVMFPKATTRKCTDKEKKRCLQIVFREPSGHSWAVKRYMFA